MESYSYVDSGINTVYRVRITVPEITRHYLLSDTGVDREFDRQMIGAFKGSDRSGSYFHDEQWADFGTLADAEKARTRGVAVVSDFTAQAQFYAARRSS